MMYEPHYHLWGNLSPHHDIRFEKWFTFLGQIRNSKKNCILSIDLFFQTYQKTPKDFYEFIYSIKDYLGNHQIPLEERKIIAEKWLWILSPVCERIWIFSEKSYLDDKAFFLLFPEEATNYEKKLEKYKRESKDIIQSIQLLLESILEENTIPAQIFWRYKSLYSVYKKCKKKGTWDVFSLQDIFAFRIIIDGAEEDCFQVFEILCNNLTPIASRYKDYISIPKINGYQSLHCGFSYIIPHLDLATEVQIRTRDMNFKAESGVAAHYIYSLSKTSHLINQEEQKFLCPIVGYISKSLYCLSPKWDIIEIEEWDTCLDFAEKVHSKLRAKATSCIINGKKRALSAKLENFDQVEIIIWRKESYLIS